MIVVQEQIFNNYDQIKQYNHQKFQEAYDEIAVKWMHKYIRKCPNCNSHEIAGHAYYERYFIINNKEGLIRLHRVKCQKCGKTHTIFVCDLVAYSFLNQFEALDVYLENEILSNQNLYLNFFQKAVLRKVEILKGYYAANFKAVIESKNIKKINEDIIAVDQKLFLQNHRGKVFLNLTPT